jgi:hypothetical protein
MKINRDLSLYIEKKTKKKNWNTIPREKKEHFMFKPKPQYLACIDPNTYKVLKIFESITDMEKDTNSRNLQPILHRYFINNRGTPTICNWIVVKFKREEMEDISMEEFQKLINKRAIDKIIFIQLQRIRENIDSFTQEEKEKIFQFNNNVEHPNPKAINYEIQLD